MLGVGCLQTPIQHCLVWALGFEGFPGNSLLGQWLGLSASTAVAQVQSLLGEPRSCKLFSAAKKKERFPAFLQPVSETGREKVAGRKPC